MEVLMERLLVVIPLLISLGVHEWAHAWIAYLLGDDTAKHQGRLTLNPLAHIDPIGSLLLPFIGFPCGWAKPVPVNPIRFRRNISMRLGILLTAIAGPISNIVLAIISFSILFFSTRYQLGLHQGASGALLYYLLIINVILAIFNLLPIPPLDGSRVADSLMPEKFRPHWDQFCTMGPFILVAVILVPALLGVNLFAAPLTWINQMLKF